MFNSECSFSRYRLMLEEILSSAAEKNKGIPLSVKRNSARPGSGNRLILGALTEKGDSILNILYMK